MHQNNYVNKYRHPIFRDDEEVHMKCNNNNEE